MSFMALAPIGLQHFLVLSAILFAIGMFGALSRSNAVGVLLSIEFLFRIHRLMTGPRRARIEGGSV